MEDQNSRARVLARIPDLSAAASASGKGGGLRGAVVSASMGRILSQSLSFKILAGVTVALLAAAIIPYSFNLQKTATNPPPANDQLPWQAETSGAGTNPPAPPPKATLVRAMPEKASAPGALALPPPVTHDAPPSQANDASAMSKWPNPAYGGPRRADSETADAAPRANRPQAVPTPQYQADSRNADQANRPWVTPPAAPTEQPANRNRYDATRPSIH
jgi:hypothetical protein